MTAHRPLRSRKWNQPGGKNSSIARNQWNLFNDARRRDDLIRRIGLEIQLRALTGYFERNRENRARPYEAAELEIVKIQVESPEFD
jgi:hypothetical protein